MTFSINLNTKQEDYDQNHLQGTSRDHLEADRNWDSMYIDYKTRLI